LPSIGVLAAQKEPKCEGPAQLSGNAECAILLHSIVRLPHKWNPLQTFLSVTRCGVDFPVTPECLTNEQAEVTPQLPHRALGKRQKGEIAYRNADETSYRQDHRD
jgi:hypothetical protein